MLFLFVVFFGNCYLLKCAGKFIASHYSCLGNKSNMFALHNNSKPLRQFILGFQLPYVCILQLQYIVPLLYVLELVAKCSRRGLSLINCFPFDNLLFTFKVGAFFLECHQT